MTAVTLSQISRLLKYRAFKKFSGQARRGFLSIKNRYAALTKPEKLPLNIKKKYGLWMFR
jgi:hypothetical protein